MAGPVDEQGHWPRAGSRGRSPSAPPGRWCWACHPPRPPWLHDILTAVVLAELSANLSGTDEGRSLDAAARLYESAAEKVALNPQPLPPLEEQCF
jgi:hypothetical protein